jgi:fructose-1,6-bisphosphatase II / sedoheptulose-1,7-bisphosphatase
MHKNNQKTMKLKNILYDLITTSEDAAIAAAKWIGKNDEKAADRAAVEAMRDAFNRIPFQGKIVIGEGERDEAPMLHIGEMVGADNTNNKQTFDIAVDPLECTTKCARGIDGSMTSMVVSEGGMLLPAPDVYMQKIAAKHPVIDLDKSIEENLKALAEAKECDVSELVVVILDRERHKNIVDEVLSIGAKIRMISDGDIAGAIMTCIPESEVDMYIGVGGAPEGVIASAAVTMLGGYVEGRLIFKDESQVVRAKTMLQNPQRKYSGAEMVNMDGSSGEIAFIITGVTSGDLVEGVKLFDGDGIKTETLCIYRDKDGMVWNRKVRTLR